MLTKEEGWHQARDEYTEYLKIKGKSESTIKTYVAIILRTLIWIGKYIDDITNKDLEQLKLHFIDGKKKNGQPYSRNSLIGYSAAIKHFFTMLNRSDIIFESLPGIDPPEIVALTVEEVRKILEVAQRKGLRAYAIILTLYYGALRITECLNLNIDDIDFEREKLRINISKTRKAAHINLKQPALQALREYIDQERPKNAGDSNALFVSYKSEGRRLTRNPVWKLVKECAVEAGIKKRVYPHLFRHSMLTHMAENGARLQDIMKQSRHRDVKTAMRYIHMCDEKARETYDRTAPDIYSQQSTEEPEMTEEPESTKDSEPDTTPPPPKVVTNEENHNLLEQTIMAFNLGKMTEATFNRLLDIYQSDTKMVMKNDENLGYFG